VPLAQHILLTLYYASLAVVASVMLYRALLIVRYYLRPRDDEAPRERFAREPVVTVQLPVFNEQFVVERLLESVCAMDWPRDRLQVQLLDDSTDDTVAIAAGKVAELVARGFDVVHVHRTDRTGYKAGALREATPRARGQFLAVFDADFVPSKDFLRRTVDHFTDPTVGFVQARWDYLNRDHNMLTQGMAMLMDGHFVLEQVTRSRGGYIFNFNGTGGLWRRSAIDAAGGWQDDTICEDTDLSYRASLAGYRGVYLKDVACPSELPVDVASLKSQQHRWAKGLTECFMKLMPVLWRSRLSLAAKIEGTFHLGANLAFPASLLLTVLALPVMLVRMHGATPGTLAGIVDAIGFPLVVVTQLLFYAVATWELHPDWRRRLSFLPFPTLVGVGLAVNNARGVLEALTGHKTEFVRTPKVGTEDRGLAKQRVRTYAGNRHLVQGLLEVGLGAYYVVMALTQLRGSFLGAAIAGFLSAGLFLMGGASLRLVFRRPAAARDHSAGGSAPLHPSQNHPTAALGAPQAPEAALAPTQESVAV
jgi:cellulose synthase/poly-beta-1,6-N-acetylglucosamine synthase-like glycosyltransferase